MPEQRPEYLRADAETKEVSRQSYEISTSLRGPETLQHDLDEINKEIDKRCVDFETYLEKNGVEGPIAKSLGFNEALVNAVYHGNFGINGHKHMDLDWVSKAEEDLSRRLKQGEAIAGAVRVKIENSPDKIIAFVEDQGQGFDWRNLSNPTAEENLMEQTGRGIFLIHQAFGEENVRFNEQGNQIALIIKK